MNIRYAILGLLSWQPLSGYDLKKIFASSELFYWSGNNNQIYRNLVQLHTDGLVTQQVQVQESLPAKKIYSLTDQGRAALHQWALEDPQLPEVHNPFLIQLAWAEDLTDAELDDLLGRYEAELALQLNMSQARSRLPAETPNRSPREAYIWQVIGEHQQAAYQNELTWVQQVRAGLEHVDSGTPA